MGVGTPRYAAPEVFRTQPTSTYDERVDVYSFGLLLWEMSHTQIAFEGISGLQAAVNAAAGARPTISLTGSGDMEGWPELIEACWHHEPSARMQMPACAEKLASMLRRLQAPAGQSAGRFLNPGGTRDKPTFVLPDDSSNAQTARTVSGDVSLNSAKVGGSWAGTCSAKLPVGAVMMLEDACSGSGFAQSQVGGSAMWPTKLPHAAAISEEDVTSSSSGAGRG